MSFTRISCNLLRKNIRRNYCSVTTVPQSEYTAVPHYPEILDMSKEKVKEREKDAEYETIRKVKTVEEKQIKLNMPKYYGYKCYLFHEDVIPHDNLQLVQHATRTHLVLSETMPEYYNNINIDSYIGNLKPQIEEALAIELEGYKEMIDKSNLTEKEIENVTTSKICKHINRVLINNMVQDYNHLLDVQVDYDPRFEAFWFVGGMSPTKFIRKVKEGPPKRKKHPNPDEPIDRAFQYSGNPAVCLRSSVPLKPIMPHVAATVADFPIPKFTVDPRTVGLFTKYQHGVNTPGYWPGDQSKFGLISYHKRGHFLNRKYYGDVDYQEALHVQGVLASYARLCAEANFLGFTTFNEITYPLVAQTVITNGKLWSFYNYQLNTLLMNGRHINGNPKVNICYASPELKLYEEFKNGKLEGFNEEVLTRLVKLYANVPEERLGVNMTPNLSQDEKLIADYEDEEKRVWLEKEYKIMLTNKPKTRLPFEIYHWEKIYKIDFKTRPMDKRLRPFELFKQPYKRTMDDRLPRYIPRVLRPNLKRWQGRFAKEYFP